MTHLPQLPWLHLLLLSPLLIHPDSAVLAIPEHDRHDAIAQLGLPSALMILFQDITWLVFSSLSK